MSEILLIFIFFIAGFIHGLVGFAFALTALPLLALIKSVKFSVPLLSLFSFTVNLVMLFILREKRIFKIPLRFFLVIALGVFIGVRGFTISSEFFLRVLLLIAMILFALWEMYRLFHEKKMKYLHDIDERAFKSPIALLTAFLVGFLGGILNTPGPPIVMYLTLLRFDKNIFKASLQLIFAFSSFTAALNHYLAGNLKPEHFKLFIVSLPAVFLGMFLGQRLYLKVSNRVYYYLVNVFLIISALLLLLKHH